MQRHRDHHGRHAGQRHRTEHRRPTEYHRQTTDAQQHPEHTERRENPLLQPDRCQPAGEHRGEPEDYRYQTRRDVLGAPVDAQHGCPHAKRCGNIGLQRRAPPSNTATQERHQQQAGREPDHHPAGCGKQHARALCAPFDGERRGGPDQDHTQVRDRDRHRRLLVKTHKQQGRSAWIGCGPVPFKRFTADWSAHAVARKKSAHNTPEVFRSKSPVAAAYGPPVSVTRPGHRRRGTARVATPLADQL